MVVRPFYGTFSRPILGKNGAKSPLQVIFCPCIKAELGVFQWYWGVFECVLGCFREVLGYFGSKHMVLQPFWGAFSRPILGKNSAKSPLEVMFCPCIKAVLGVFQWYSGVFECVLRCFTVVYSVLGPETWWYGRFGVLFLGRYLAKIAQNHRCR